MADFFREYEVRGRLRELEAVDRQLEKWGWFRGHDAKPAAPGWRFHMGGALIRLGCWLQGRGEPKGEWSPSG